MRIGPKIAIAISPTPHACVAHHRGVTCGGKGRVHFTPSRMPSLLVLNSNVGRQKRSTEANTSTYNATFVSFNDEVEDKEHATFFKKRIFTSSNRILHGTDVTNNNKYPWTTLVFNRLQRPCTSVYDSDAKLFKSQDPGVAYDICSGSLISNKHILTSALCVLVNKRAMDSQSATSKKPPEYSKPECIFAIVDYTNKDIALNNEKISRIKDLYPHPQAFSDIREYNYNLGRL